MSFHSFFCEKHLIKWSICLAFIEWLLCVFFCRIELSWHNLLEICRHFPRREMEHLDIWTIVALISINASDNIVAEKNENKARTRRYNWLCLSTHTPIGHSLSSCCCWVRVVHRAIRIPIEPFRLNGKFILPPFWLITKDFIEFKISNTINYIKIVANYFNAF